MPFFIGDKMKNKFLKICLGVLFMIMLFGTNTYYANSTFNYKRQSMRIYDKLDLKKIITSDSNNIKYSSSNENVAKVDENGIVSSYNQGQVTITIQDENSTSNLILSCGFLVGMDVSRWNGNIDWDDVKQSGIDFVMIRSSYGWYGDDDREQGKPWDHQYDSYVRTNIERAVENGIDYGIYHYSYAKTVEQANLEAEYVLQALEDTNSKDRISLPVAYDLEEVMDVDKATMTDIAIAFCTKIAEAGYIPMIYANGNYYMNHLDLAKLNAMLYNFWYAWPTSNPNFSDKITISSSNVIPMMWQYSWNGDIVGAQTSDGGLDMNVLYLKDRVKLELYDQDNYIDFVGVDKGSTLEEPLPTLEKEGYNFDGYENSKGQLVDEETVFDSDDILTSKFTKIEITSVMPKFSTIEIDEKHPGIISFVYEPTNAIFNCGDVTYEVEDNSLLKVEEDGKIVALKDEGSTIVTCKYKDEFSFNVTVNVHMDYMKGDLNKDWKVNADDAAEAIEIFKTNGTNDEYLKIGDMNEDNRINAEDAALIIEYFKTHN